jgi:hypothetical protein
MPKLHELLAIETSLESQANKVRSELVNTFEKKRHLFEEKRVTFRPLAEGEEEVTESQSDIQSTVPKELEWISTFLVKALDASYQVALANTWARADVVLEDDETVILNNVPATTLLELEKRMGEIQHLLTSIPTLDPAKGFLEDPARKNIFQARPVTKNRTKKVQKPVVLYEATDKHPAQVQLATEDVVVGTISEQEWSGLITPAQKADLLARVEMLIRAIRRGRSRANDTEVDRSKKIGATLLKFILRGVDANTLSAELRQAIFPAADAK